jgi:hypothetical protein
MEFTLENLTGNLHLELSFEIGELVSPVARIYVERWSMRRADSFHYIGQDCATASELDWVVNCLIRELENVRKRGHVKFASCVANDRPNGMSLP